MWGRDVVYQRLTGIGLHVRVLSARIIDIHSNVPFQGLTTADLYCKEEEGGRLDETSPVLCAIALTGFSLQPASLAAPSCGDQTGF